MKMPTDIQSVIVYILVLSVTVFLIQKLVRNLKGRQGCGGSCHCSGDGVKRNPVIDRYIKKHRDK